MMPMDDSAIVASRLKHAELAPSVGAGVTGVGIGALFLVRALR